MKKILDFFCGIGIHFWQYRNPYHRTCRHCGKSQSFYVHSWDYWATNKNGDFEYNEKGEALCRPYNNKNGWWE